MPSNKHRLRCKSQGAVLVTCLMMLTLLAVMALGGTERTLVYHRASSIIYAGERCFLLANAALEKTLADLRADPSRLQATTYRHTEASHELGDYRVDIVYRGSDLNCPGPYEGVRDHFEIVAIATSGVLARSRQAVGISLCRYAYTDTHDSDEMVIVAGDIKKTYWRQPAAEEISALLNPMSSGH